MPAVRAETPGMAPPANDQARLRLGPGAHSDNLTAVMMRRPDGRSSSLRSIHRGLRAREDGAWTALRSHAMMPSPPRDCETVISSREPLLPVAQPGAAAGRPRVAVTAKPGDRRSPQAR